MKNKIFKYIGLEVLLLLALMLCGTIVVKIFNVALKLQFESIGTTGKEQVTSHLSGGRIRWGMALPVAPCPVAYMTPFPLLVITFATNEPSADVM